MTNIAILGFGNIGSGVAEVLLRNREEIIRATGEEITVKYVLDKRDLAGSGYEDKAVFDYDVILNDPDVSIVCEMMGGTQPAFDFSMAALKAGKSVVTSNKEVVARFGVQLLETARENGVHYLYEASVGGGIPILHAFDDSLKGCRINRIDGILNGTTNYVLTRMHDCSSSFKDALEEARQLGYAEANPTADISGSDACRKICILAAVAWGKLVSHEKVYCEGITEINSAHNDFATACGGALKLVASAYRNQEGIHLSVSPCVVMNENPLASVRGVFNAVKVDAGDLGDVLFYGMGAGKMPTASAVVSDIMAVLRRKSEMEVSRLFVENDLPLLPYDQVKSDYCVAVKANGEALTDKYSSQCLLKEDCETLYILFENISKCELDRVLEGREVSLVLRALV